MHTKRGLCQTILLYSWASRNFYDLFSVWYPVQTIRKYKLYIAQNCGVKEIHALVHDEAKKAQETRRYVLKFRT